ncbi:MAG TPA: TonB-dependent receptor, partial [Pseudomonadales bacterium]|nr:TonB-dependent receptor [Pseudomonadales bacterium]
RNFDGFEISFGVGSPSEDGGEHVDAGLLFGVTGDRGFFTAGITYIDDGDVDFQERDFSKLPILGQADLGGVIGTLLGSGIPPEGRVISPGDPAILFKPNPVTGESFQSYDTFCLNGGPGSDSSGSIDCILNQGHRFNYNDIDEGVSLINSNQAVNFAGLGEYSFDNGVISYLNVVLAHREGRLNFTPLPVQGAAGRFTDLLRVPLNNPNIPTDALALITSTRAANATCDAACQAADIQMSYRGLDFGVRTFEYDSDTLSATIGLKGSFGDLGASGALGSWDWDLWMTAGRSELFEVTSGQLNVANLQISVDPAACALTASCPKDSLGNPTMDIFGRGVKSAEEKSFATFDDLERSDYDMLHFAATVAGEFGNLPAGTVGVAAGAEYREEQGGVQTSGVVQAGDSGGNFAEPTNGEFDVTEFYAEFAIPLLAGAPMAEALDLDLAIRWSDYNTFGDETTYKASIGWMPIETLKFRGTYATGYRGPNILELFGGIADTFQSVTDPCTNPVADANVAANCAAHGVPAGFVQPAAQLKISAGGNEELQPETSESYSVGLVWQPEFADLSISLDWYDVQVDDAVGTPKPTNVITTCYDSPNGSLSAPECGRISRGNAGDVVRFDLLNENLNKIETSGIDLTATYAVTTGWGEVQVNWLLNYLDEYVETTDTGVVDDRTGVVAGSVSSFAAYPEFRSNLDVTLNRETWSAGITYRYLDEMEAFDVIGFGTLEPTADAQHYFDLMGTYRLDRWNFLVGVRNVTDEEPPYVTDVSANTSSIYDFLGRFYYARVNFVVN